MSALRRVVALAQSGRRRLLLAVALGVLAAGAAVVLAGTSAWLIARAAEQPPVLHLMVAVVTVRAAGIGRGVFRYLERLVSHDASFRVLADLRVALVRRLERLLPGSRTLGRGDLLARFVGDVDGLVDLWVRLLLPAAVTVTVGTAAVVTMVVLLPAAGVVLALSATVAMVLAPVVAERVAGHAAAAIAPERGAHQERLLAALDGVAELQVYGAAGRAVDELAHRDDALRRAEARSALGAGAGGALAVAAAGLGLVATTWIGASALADGTIDGVTLAVIVLLPLSVHEMVGLLAPAASQLPTLADSARRLVAVLDEPDVVPPPLAPAPVPTGPLGLSLTGVAVGWPGCPVLLERLDLDLAPGATVAVAGPSGVGKSTLAATLLGFIPSAAGTIRLRGDRSVDLVALDGDELRKAVGWCPQDAHIFDSTVAANLRFARPHATDDELRTALASVHLDGWLAALPDGLSTMVGEHGSTLSGGERQRLALARVVLSGSRVVVIDEPTEHLDEQQARAVVEELLAVLAGRTVVIITHRPDLLPASVPVYEVGDAGALLGRPADAPD